MNKLEQNKLINRISSQLKDALKDLESLKHGINEIKMQPKIPAQVTLDDLYKALGNYKPAYKNWLKAAVEENNIQTLDELLRLRPREVKKMKHIGITTLYYIREALEDLGVQW
jgi:DNA-directed RNA polymerase alpha subunit